GTSRFKPKNQPGQEPNQVTRRSSVRSLPPGLVSSGIQLAKRSVWERGAVFFKQSPASKPAPPLLPSPATCIGS
ncbi:hypothetical protein LINPERHAP1_LOCUS3947, partial [Linum perenne]